MTKNIKKFIVVVLLAVLGAGLNFSKDTFAEIVRNNPNSGSGGCCATVNGSQICSDYCWTSYLSSGGGQVWIFVPNTKVTYNNLASIKVPNTATRSASSTADCTGTKPTNTFDCSCKSDAEGVYFLGALWHKNGSNTLEGHVWGPVSPAAGNHDDTVVTSWSDGSYTVSEQDAKAAYEDFGGTAWGTDTVFCGQKPGPKVTYSGRSGARANNSGSYTWGGTANYPGEVSPGDTVTVSFEHRVQASSDAAGKVNFSVANATTSGGTLSKDSSKSSSKTSPQSTSSTSEITTAHNVYNLAIPSSNSNNAIDYYINVCQTQSYSNKSEGALNRTSSACVKIHVKREALTCPLPASLFTAPAAGTKDTGTTKSGSGVKSNVFTTYGSLIYAKPDDNIAWAHCYFPEAQAARYTDETDSEPKPTGTGPTKTATSAVGPRDGKIPNTSGVVQNTFTISTSNSSSFTPSVDFTKDGGFKDNYTVSGSTFTGKKGNPGGLIVFSKKKNPSNSYTINKGYAGITTTQTVATDTGTASSTGHSSWTWTYTYTGTCPKTGGGTEPCSKTGNGTGTHTGNSFYKITNQTSWNNDSSHASVYIPYNFDTSVNNVKFTAGDISGEYVPAGESISASADFNILQRTNGTTSGTYATETPADTKIQIVAYYIADGTTAPAAADSDISDGNLCTYFNQSSINANGCKNVKNQTGKLNSDGNLNGSTTTLSASGIAIHNVPTGYKICLAAGISHSNSKNDTNDSGAGTVNSNWRISASTCRTVIKKPNLQVWGGSFASSGPVTTSIAQKDFINKTFGSWDEFAVVAAGSTTIKNMASGAALGYTSSYASNSTAGGSATKFFCNRAPLSIANNNCVPGTGSNTGSISGSGITLSATLYDRIKSRFTSATVTPTYTSGNVDLNSHYAIGPGFRITKATGDIHITAAPSLIGGITHVIYSDGDIYIDTDLKLNTTNEGAKYHDTSELPQYLIISNKNIKIDPSVSQVDAWLVTKTGEVNTCSGHTLGTDLDTTDTNCGKRLVINGPVIAKKLVANRTYGAGAGDSGFTDTTSVQSAETFNLPLTSYLWAYAWANRNPQAYTVYTRSLAPRL